MIASAENPDVLSPLDSLDVQLRRTIESSLELLVPVEPQPVRIDCDDRFGSMRSKYDAFVHAQLCRMKILGLSNAAAARAVGLAPTTLATWLRNRPKLAADMDRAVELANAHAALLLRGMMNGDGPTAFNAVKLFLSTHSPEFKERTVIEVSPGEPDEVLDKIRRGMYGIDVVESSDAAVPVASASSVDSDAGLSSEVRTLEPVPVEMPDFDL